MSKNTKMVRVMIADDHPVVRMGIRLMLEMDEDIELIGEAIDGETALEMASEMSPDIILMDLRMPGIDGLEVVKRLRTSYPKIAVIMLTTYNEDDLMIACLRAGARGYLLKDADIQVVIQTIHAAARGEMLMQPEVMERILARAERAIPTSRHAHERKNYAHLTAREQDILTAVARGERSKEIARHFKITERTVAASLSTIYIKLGVDSRAAAVAVALEHGLLSDQQQKNS